MLHKNSKSPVQTSLCQACFRTPPPTLGATSVPLPHFYIIFLGTQATVTAFVRVTSKELSAQPRGHRSNLLHLRHVSGHSLPLFWGHYGLLFHSHPYIRSQKMLLSSDFVMLLP